MEPVCSQSPSAGCTLACGESSHLEGGQYRPSATYRGELKLQLGGHVKIIGEKAIAWQSHCRSLIEGDSLLPLFS